MNYKNSIEKYVTCEVHYGNSVRCFAKLTDGNWVAVFPDGNLDAVEVCPADFCSVLTTMESLGAEVRFTNHSAA